MEYLIAIIGLLVGAVAFFKNKADKSAAAEKVAETKGRDKELQVQQEDIEVAKEALNAGIEKLKAEREAQRQRDENMTLKERADRLRKESKK